MSFLNFTGGFLDNTPQIKALGAKSVLFQLGLMGACSLATLLAFEVLRPANKLVYQPKSKYYVGNKRPPKLSDSPLSWLTALIRTKEPELLDQIGLDAVAYLRFLRMLRWMFSAIAVTVCGILIPVNLIYNLQHVDSSARDQLTILTIVSVKGNILFVHVAVSYIICAIVMAFVYINWKRMVYLRRMWFRSPEYQQSFYARTLMVTNVPKKMQSDSGLLTLFQSLQVPYPTSAVHIGRKVGNLPDLIDYYNNTVRSLEEVLVRYLKDGKIGKKRPVLHLGGFLGLGGKTVDAIDFYTEKIKRMELAIEKWRDSLDTRTPESYGFASMAAVPYAHIVAAQMRGKKKNGAIVAMAPNPKDIIWSNLSASSGTIARKKTIGWILLVAFCAFNTIPLLVISLLANITALATFIKPLANWANASPNTVSLISGVLPPTVMAVFSVIFPVILRKLSKYLGAITRSGLDKSVVKRYYAFLIISQLIIFTLIGVIFKSVESIVIQVGQHKSFQEILNNLHTLPATINSTYINQSNYWLTWFPLRGFLSLFDLAQILNLVWITIKTRMFGRTPRDIRDWTKPPDFDYATYYANLLFMHSVAVIFAPLAPLVAALACVVFWISSTTYKYQLMFVYTTKVESGGKIWNVIINRVLSAVVFMQLLMTLTIGLQLGFSSFKWTATLPPLVALFVFKMYIRKAFADNYYLFRPTPEEIANARIHSERSDTKAQRLERRFGHPALHMELFTPMVHAKHAHLLAEVYHGRLGSTETRLNEFGGAKMETTIAPGGIKIAGIEQSDLEYDPALYQRDRGEADWDARSISSSTVLGGDNASLYNLKRGESPAPSAYPAGYNNYLAYGPGPGGPRVPDENIELTRLRTQDDQAPLLTHHSNTSLPQVNRQSSAWSSSQAGYYSPRDSLQYPPRPFPNEGTPPPHIPRLQSPAQMRRGLSGDDQALREAPLHRYQGSQGGSYTGYR